MVSLIAMAMTLRLTPEQDATLSRLSRERGVSKQQTVVRLIEEAAEKNRPFKFSDIKRIKLDVSVQEMIDDERGRLESYVR